VRDRHEVNRRIGIIGEYRDCDISYDNIEVPRSVQPESKRSGIPLKICLPGCAGKASSEFATVGCTAIRVCFFDEDEPWQARARRLHFRMRMMILLMALLRPAIHLSLQL
jgi:hypothetical protein